MKNIPLFSYDKELYSDDLAPIAPDKRTWNKWHLAALWVGMAVCIPTYLLASYMITQGMHWLEAIVIIGVANLIITIPMVLNGHAGVKYGIPFPVIGRSCFGIKGVHIPSIVRAFIACGWFGIQTWIGGLAIYAIVTTLMGIETDTSLSLGKFIAFGIFWLVNIYFIWRGTESIKWLEEFSAPILILMGLLLIYWGYQKAGGFDIVLQQSQQLEKPAATLVQENDAYTLQLHPLHDKNNVSKADEFLLTINGVPQTWKPVATEIALPEAGSTPPEVSVQFRKKTADNSYVYSSIANATLDDKAEKTASSRIWNYILWLTIMVGFWATMSISISDITRFAIDQKAQIEGQFLGLPLSMMLYSFVGIFVTCAAVINFNDILIANDAPWDPVSLIAKFDNKWVVIFAQVMLLIATLSTNIAANVIAPANIFANIYPQKIDFKRGGLIAGLIGIALCPWWLLNDISNLLIFVSGLLGPVLGIMLADYFVVRKTQLSLSDLFHLQGQYTYQSGFNIAAIIALVVGVIVALLGYFIEALSPLYKLSWFSGFGVAFLVYVLLMRQTKST
ncbi:MAG: NCS1 family nucleobase:cation symporter-1 [Chitinophagales bacterium]|nr:NCS1 family nucleobase:cation symporter-1 [Bacteroidota bacterium]MCB9044403.1 NCS1 family nucleobase:cation symporter-1 [Chitinophagales bacterium]